MDMDNLMLRLRIWFGKLMKAYRIYKFMKRNWDDPEVQRAMYILLDRAKELDEIIKE